MNISYNLADISLYYPYSPEYEQHLTETGCRRFYIGSYMCGKYCMKSMDFFLWRILPFLENNAYHVTLVVPVPTEHENCFLKDHIALCLERYSHCVDEIVVNDYGMLAYISELQTQYPVRITAGRLFSKNMRDPRYADYGSKSTRVFFPPLLAGRVSAIEIDPVTAVMDLSDIPEDIAVHAHYPYTYVTCGQNCEFAAAMHEEYDRFRGNPRCALSCMRGHMETKADGSDFLVLGKGVYTESLQPDYAGREPDRYIYWSAKEFLHPDQ